MMANNSDAPSSFPRNLINGSRHSMATPLRAVAILLIGAMMFLGAGCNISLSDEPVETRDDGFGVGSSPRLVVESFNGRVTVNAAPGNRILIQATLKRADRVDYEVSQSGDTVRVVASKIGKTIGRSPSVEIEVTAPSSTIIEIRTSNGAIELRGMGSSGIMTTSNGKIGMENVTGDFTGYTSNGAIEVVDFEGTVDLETSNGTIRFSGELKPGGRNAMRTSNGGVTVTLAGIPSVRLEASTSNGSIKSELPLLATSTGDNHLAGAIGDGEAELTIRTSNGSVTIR